MDSDLPMLAIHVCDCQHTHLCSRFNDGPNACNWDACQGLHLHQLGTTNLAGYYPAGSASYQNQRHQRNYFSLLPLFQTEPSHWLFQHPALQR